MKKGDYWYKVLPVDPEEFKQNYSKKFWDASEANDGKYDLDPATCGLKDVKTGKMPDFYFGYPFPKIDPKEPLAACKMAWNFEAANSMGEGQGATFTLNGIDTSGEFKRIKLWLHANSFLGRHGGPIDNPENLRTTALSNVLEPQDVDGVGGLTKRENNWDAQDKAWFYVPSTRRVRRVNAATRSDPVAGLDIFADDLNCYGGKIEYYKWKLVGEQNILAPVLSPKPLRQEKTRSPTRFEVEIPYFKGAYETPGAKGRAVAGRRQPRARCRGRCGCWRASRAIRTTTSARSSCTWTRTCTGSTGSWCTTAPASISTTRSAPTTSRRATTAASQP